MIRNFTSVTKEYDQVDNTTFINYKVVENGNTFFVPHNEANKDYQAIQEWIAAGNTVVDNPPSE